MLPSEGIRKGDYKNGVEVWCVRVVHLKKGGRLIHFYTNFFWVIILIFKNNFTIRLFHILHINSFFSSAIILKKKVNQVTEVSCQPDGIKKTEKRRCIKFAQYVFKKIKIGNLINRKWYQLVRSPHL